MCRERYPFDIKKLLEDKLVPHRPNEFFNIKCKINGFPYEYFGQVDPTGEIPDGVGVAIDKEGDILEGGFENGKFG